MGFIVIFKEMYQAQLEFPRGVGSLGINLFLRGSMNIYWKYTFSVKFRGKSKTTELSY